MPGVGGVVGGVGDSRSAGAESEYGKTPDAAAAVVHTAVSSLCSSTGKSQCVEW